MAVQLPTLEQRASTSMDRLNAMENKLQKGACLYWPKRSNGLEPSPRVVALNEEETAASQRVYEEPGVY